MKNSGSGVSVERYAADVANELCMALFGLVEEVRSEEWKIKSEELKNHSITNHSFKKGYPLYRLPLLLLLITYWLLDIYIIYIDIKEGNGIPLKNNCDTVICDSLELLTQLNY